MTWKRQFEMKEADTNEPSAVCFEHVDIVEE
jgi:hypothetical protein